LTYRGASTTDVMTDLIAYRTGGVPMDIQPLSRDRPWLKDSPIASRCLPLLLAAEYGWAVINPSGFTAVWTGGAAPGSLRIVTDDDAASPAVSHFGEGIVTFQVPYLFRTPPGWNVLLRGPANAPHDGVCALEGLVETDWAPQTSTMNWKLTRAGGVRFEAGCVAAVVVPVQRGDLARWKPSIQTMPDDLNRDYRDWADARYQFNLDTSRPPRSWQKHYYRGTHPAAMDRGEPVQPGHETRLVVPPFSQR
jgi:hypothetical protein